MLREKDYRVLAPRLGLREVNISNQHADDKCLAAVIPRRNCVNIKRGTSAHVVCPVQAKLSQNHEPRGKGGDP